MKRSWLKTVLSPWSEILQNSSCVCVAVYEILTAPKPALPEEIIPKHMRSTQYLFEVFKDVECFLLLRRRHLDKAGTLLFHSSTMQRYKGNAVACSKPPALETCSDSVWYFIGFNAEYLWWKGVCHDSQTDPLDAPLPVSILCDSHFHNLPVF